MKNKQFLLMLLFVATLFFGSCKSKKELSSTSPASKLKEANKGIVALKQEMFTNKNYWGENVYLDVKATVAGGFFYLKGGKIVLSLDEFSSFGQWINGDFVVGGAGTSQFITIDEGTMGRVVWIDPNQNYAVGVNFNDKLPGRVLYFVPDAEGNYRLYGVKTESGGLKVTYDSGSSYYAHTFSLNAYLGLRPLGAGNTFNQQNQTEPGVKPNSGTSTTKQLSGNTGSVGGFTPPQSTGTTPAVNGVLVDPTKTTKTPQKSATTQSDDGGF